MKRSVIVLSVVLGAAAVSAKPLALVGNDNEVQAVQSDITNRERIPSVVFLKSLPESYDDFAAVVFCGPTPRGVKAEDIPAGVRVVRCEAVSALRNRYFREKKPLAEADNKGESVLTAEGEHVRDMTERNRKAILAVPGIDRSLPPCEWDTVPLGAPGPLVYPQELPRKPEFRAPPVRGEGLALLDGARQAVIVADKRRWRPVALAKELAWHLEKMSGRPFKVVSSAEAAETTPVVELREVHGKPLGRSEIRREGNRLILSGESNGLGHALTYFLESLGCRYLWPGTDGKVIPKKETIVCPDIAYSFVPSLKVREIREYEGMHKREFANIGLDMDAFAAAYRTAAADHPGNRGFFAWHGVNDGRNLGGNYRWGHYFADYYKRFSESNPEWFGMQANGSRIQYLGDRSNRPTLCLSNAALAEQAAKDISDTFAKHPDILAHSICLPDGGYMGQCMCRACRSLDPVNAQPIVNHTCSPLWRTYPYVALTDRVMTFNNRIAEAVVAKYPDRKLSAYVYSYYEAPPKTVKPHPSLVLLTVAGTYTGKDRSNARRNIAAWSTFGNELFWRPNGLGGWKVNMPQSLARALFEDLEAIKCNNVIGTDFDDFRRQWAGRGFETYMLAKAHLNPDRLDFDTIARDWCEKGFGAAAEDIAQYLSELEKYGDRAAAAGASANDYATGFDIELFAGILKRARVSAADDAVVLRRIAFLETALVYARWEKRLAEAVVAGDRASVAAIQRDYLAFVREHAAENAVAFHPKSLGSTFVSPNMRGAY
ncbi:MAG: DUF4838 domain-containing protein [Kiritimatiellae bacterium]|nr:DUF4838 domain-containing protein [Kiritimatiellia bacterium]